MTAVSVLGIDLGKNSCSVVGLNNVGTVVLRRRVTWDGVAAPLAKLPTGIVAMEVCCGAYFVGRAAQAHGIKFG